ncbi:MAG: type II secretion system protein [Planctomycetia bacterium]|nr:MAG: type II secretion system protein [Planctomycetia bacterium]
MRVNATGQSGLRRGFTLVELLVVIFIIGLLTTLVVVGMGKAIDIQRENATRSRMGTILGAVDQFATEDPLRANFNARRVVIGGAGRRVVEPSFGPYPPYSLAGDARLPSGANYTQIAARAVVEPDLRTYGQVAPPQTFEQRIARALGWEPNGAITSARRMENFALSRTRRPDLAADRANDDIRSLYAFLKIYSSGALSQVPEAAIRRLTDRPELVFPKGNGDQYDATAANPRPPEGAVDVFGFVDAWGVPMDYFVQVKVAFITGEDGLLGWRIVDRQPVLRSHGLTREVFDAGKRVEAAAIYSTPLPAPIADIKADTGILGIPDDDAQAQYLGGWFRLRHGSGTATPERDNVESYGFR